LSFWYSFFTYYVINLMKTILKCELLFVEFMRHNLCSLDLTIYIYIYIYICSLDLTLLTLIAETEFTNIWAQLGVQKDRFKNFKKKNRKKKE